ncbi:capsid protein [Nomiamastrel virus]
MPHQRWDSGSKGYGLYTGPGSGSRRLTPEERSRIAVNREAAKRRRLEIAAARELSGVRFRDVFPRPSLQVATYNWTPNKQGVEFGPNGSCYNFTAFGFGSADFQRHTNTTKTYKFMMRTQVALDTSLYGYVFKYNMYWWLIYDKFPSSIIATKDIFDQTYTERPSTWCVKRDVTHRFIVKKKWKNTLSTTGIKPSETGKIGTPGNLVVDCNKFFTKLGVTTQWKNTSSGDLSDIKEGALYLVGAPQMGTKTLVYGTFRVYFKSVGNL